MKAVLLTGLLLGVICTAAIGAAPEIRVEIAIPQNRHGERAVQYSLRERFHVILTNSSEKPKRIWKEWCSWGVFRTILRADRRERQNLEG
jgi:hypothetical protein